MHQAELIYSVKEIFSDCLHHYNDATGFYIAPYQRGYKWGSGNNEPVMQLMKDTHEACQNSLLSINKEYYLQYITLKPIKVNGQQYALEVIDGQQRLTTLSILLAVLRHTNAECENVANLKINYALSRTFLEDWIYDDNIRKLLQYENWEAFSNANKENNKQDVYYLFQAANALSVFVDTEIGSENVKSYYKYLADSVKLIVNAVEPHVESERVFRNLNSFKIPLTQAELIKALLLTKAPRTKDEYLKSKRFKEVMDMRSAMGRKWDEMQIDLNEPNIKAVFFPSQTDVMQGLLHLTATLFGFKQQQGGNEKYPLFEFFQSQIQQRKVTASEIFEKAFIVYKLLIEWYKDDFVFNALGFLFYNKNSNSSSIGLLPILVSNSISNSKPPLKVLKDLILKNRLFILGDDLRMLDYNETKDRPIIQDVLLLINLFTSKIQRFNFADYEDKVWSLEHIFPQNPNLAGDSLSAKDKEVLKEIVNDNEKWESIELLLDKTNLNEQEIELLNEKLKADAFLLNNIGNMALLPVGENAGLGNKLFNKKREKICEQISAGSFVPSHTFNVFSKLILPISADLKYWDKKDIEAHQLFIFREVARIKFAFENTL